MSGISPALFIRKALPKEFFCSVCLQILVDPIYCPNCSIIVCSACLPKTLEGSKCSHEGKYSENTLMNKINGLYIKCKNWTHGCMKLCKLKDLATHEQSCVFAHSHCHQPDCVHANNEKRLDKHVTVCPLEHIRCELHGFEAGKSIETPCHSCSQWLKDVSENFEIKTNIYKDENEEIRHEMGTLKVQFEANKQALRTQISETDAKNRELERNYKTMCEIYEEKIRKLQEESAYKMKVFHENADERIQNYLKNTNENFKQFSTKLTEMVKSYLENVKGKAAAYNESIEKRADAFIDRKVLEAVKSQGNKGKIPNNTTFLSGSTNNTTMISNANNSILK